jgi:hypothetical protein
MHEFEVLSLKLQEQMRERLSHFKSPPGPRVSRNVSLRLLRTFLLGSLEVRYRGAGGLPKGVGSVVAALTNRLTGLVMGDWACVAFLRGKECHAIALNEE